MNDAATNFRRTPWFSVLFLVAAVAAPTTAFLASVASLA